MERDEEEKKIARLVEPRGDDSWFSDGGHEGWDKGGGNQLLSCVRFCLSFYFHDRKGQICGWKKRKSHQTSEGRLLSKLRPQRVLSELQLD